MTAVAWQVNIPPGGVDFTLPRLGLGVCLVPQPTHHVTLSTRRRRHVPMRANEGWILQAGSVGLCEYDDAHAYLFAEFTDSLLDSVGFDRQGDFEPVIGPLDPLLVQLVHHAAFGMDDAPPLYRETMRLALAAHVGRLLGWQGANASHGVNFDRRLRRAEAYIHEHLGEEICLERLARESSMSRYHFVRTFKANFGLSPYQYVIRERMKRAALLLRATRQPLADVAYDVGYHDLSRFARHFRRHTGTTPLLFRQT